MNNSELPLQCVTALSWANRKVLTPLPFSLLHYFQYKEKSSDQQQCENAVLKPD